MDWYTDGALILLGFGILTAITTAFWLTYRLGLELDGIAADLSSRDEAQFTRIKDLYDQIKTQRDEITRLDQIVNGTGAPRKPGEAPSFSEQFEYLNGQLYAIRDRVTELRSDTDLNEKRLDDTVSVFGTLRSRVDKLEQIANTDRSRIDDLSLDGTTLAQKVNAIDDAANRFQARYFDSLVQVEKRVEALERVVDTNPDAIPASLAQFTEWTAIANKSLTNLHLDTGRVENRIGTIECQITDLFKDQAAIASCVSEIRGIATRRIKALEQIVNQPQTVIANVTPATIDAIQDRLATQNENSITLPYPKPNATQEQIAKESQVKEWYHAPYRDPLELLGNTTTFGPKVQFPIQSCLPECKTGPEVKPHVTLPSRDVLYREMLTRSEQLKNGTDYDLI